MDLGPLRCAPQPKTSWRVHKYSNPNVLYSVQRTECEIKPKENVRRPGLSLHRSRAKLDRADVLQKPSKRPRNSAQISQNTAEKQKSKAAPVAIRLYSWALNLVVLTSPNGAHRHVSESPKP